jgi:FixJ family two-component response regulator
VLNSNPTTGSSIKGGETQMFLVNDALPLPGNARASAAQATEAATSPERSTVGDCWPSGDGAPCVFVLDEDESARSVMGEILGSVGLSWLGFSCPFVFFEHLRRQPRRQPGSCLILETQFSFVSGLEVQRHLLSLSARLPVIFVTEWADVRMAVKAVHAGAIDYLPKPVAAQELIDAVSIALIREHDRREEEHALINLSLRFDTLSLRERQVMERVTSGKRNRQVGAELGISEITVKVHRGQVMRKMGVSSLAELVRVRALLERMPNERQTLQGFDVEERVARERARDKARDCRAHLEAL